MKQYHDMQKAILKGGTKKAAAREGMPGTVSLFGYQNRYDLKEGFPIVTTKEVNFKNIVVELMWFLKGDTNVKFLNDNGCKIWNEDAYNYYVKLCKRDNIEKIYTFKEFQSTLNNNTGRLYPLPQDYIPGDCGKQYGWLWRHLGDEENLKDDCGELLQAGIAGIDQLQILVKGLIENPMSRRHIIDAWNPSTLDDMALHPCHVLIQFNCRELTIEEIEALVPKDTPEHLFSTIFNAMPKYYLDCQLYQRSADTFLGVPYNISSYSLLTILLSNLLNMVPGDFIHTFGDAHIYDNHISQTNVQINRKPFKLPKLIWSEGLINVFKNLKVERLTDTMKADLIVEVLESFELEDVALVNYKHHPKLPGKLSTGIK